MAKIVAVLLGVIPALVLLSSIFSDTSSDTAFAREMLVRLGIVAALYALPSVWLSGSLCPGSLGVGVFGCTSPLFSSNGVLAVVIRVLILVTWLDHSASLFVLLYSLSCVVLPPPTGLKATGTRVRYVLGADPRCGAWTRSPCRRRGSTLAPVERARRSRASPGTPSE